MYEFIAWDEKRKKMLRGDGQAEVGIIAWSGDIFPIYKSSTIDGDYYSSADLDDYLFHRDIILFQDIGKTDDTPEQNKIYADSSIVEFDLIGTEKDKKLRGYFTFNNQELIFDIFTYEGNYNLLMYDIRNLKVIGNLQENPELLK